MARLFLLTVVPGVLVWTFVSELVIGIVLVVRHACNECARELDSVKRAWKANSINSENW